MGTGREIPPFQTDQESQTLAACRNTAHGVHFLGSKDQTKFVDRQIVLHKILGETAEPESKRIISFCSPGKILKIAEKKYGTPSKRPRSVCELRPEPAQSSAARRVDRRGSSASEPSVWRREH